MSVQSPIEIDGQYRALREEAGYAVCRRGFVSVSGPDAAEYLQGQLTNDIEALDVGEGAYAALLDRKGRMQADMRVLRAEDEILMDVEPEVLGTVVRHLTMYSVGREVSVAGVPALSMLALAGPAAAHLTGLAPLSLEHAHHPVEIDGVAGRAARTPAGLDLFVAEGEAESVARALEARSVALASEDAFEILRVESGRPRYGREMTTETIPQEAGINERAVSFTKGCYIGQETVARLHYKGKPNRHLRGLALSAPASGGAQVSLGEKVVGRIGTSVLSPALGPIALAILRREAAPGDLVTIDGEIDAKVVELPFRDS